MVDMIKDKRSTTKLDRELILKRLQRPVENKKISQSPELEEEPQPLKKRVKTVEEEVSEESEEPRPDEQGPEKQGNQRNKDQRNQKRKRKRKNL
jgi:hypothetical protein